MDFLRLSVGPDWSDDPNGRSNPGGDTFFWCGHSKSLCALPGSSLFGLIL
jgi:hypothetical protein